MKRFAALAGVAVLALSSFGGATIARAGDSIEAVKPAVKSVTESKTGSYIVVLKANPLVKTLAPDQIGTAAAVAPAASLDASHDQVMVESGVSTSTKVADYTNVLNGFAAHISLQEATTIAANPKVALVLPDEMRQLASDGDADGARTSDAKPATVDNPPDSVPSTGVKGSDNLGNFLGLTGKGHAWESGVTGEGVVIGVIDTGIWPEHPSFADDGTYPAPRFPLENTPDDPSCKFGTTTLLPAKNNDAPFACNNKLIGAREFLAGYGAPSSTPLATTTATAPTPPRRPAVTPTCSRRSSAWTTARSRASRRAPRSSPTRPSANRAAPRSTWLRPSTRRSPTTST